jgi:hypothetical protein
VILPDAPPDGATGSGRTESCLRARTYSWTPAVAALKRVAALILANSRSKVKDVHAVARAGQSCRRVEVGKSQVNQGPWRHGSQAPSLTIWLVGDAVG